MDDTFQKFLKLDREISTNYFDACVRKILNFLLIENKKIVDFFENNLGRSLKIREIVDLPLITISGGEMINMYSDMDSIVATKDLDCKITLPGVYSLPYDSLWLSLINDKNIIVKGNELFKIYNKDSPNLTVDKLLVLTLKNLMNIEPYFQDKSICNYQSWFNYMNDVGYNNIQYLKNIIKNYIDSESGNPNLFIIYDKIIESRGNFIKNILKDFRKNFMKNNYFYTKNNKLISIDHFNILLNDGLNSFISEINKVDDNYFQILDDHVIIPITIMVPKLNKKSRTDKFLNFPFKLNQPIIGKNDNGAYIYKDVFFNNNLGDIDLFKNLLYDMNDQISQWFDLTEDQENFILDSFLNHFDLFYIKWALSAIFNIKFYIIFNKNNPYDWNITINSEGFVDIWSEYYLQYSELKAKRFYEYKLPTGDLPCIVEKIDINGYDSYLKIPSIFWAIKDQTGMLVLALRKERIPPIGGWTEDSAQFIPTENDPLKYCKKTRSLLKGLWILINKVKEDIKNKNIDQYDDFLKKCKDEIGFDIIECGADGYISYLFKNNNEYWKRVGYDNNADDHIQQTIENSIIPNIETGNIIEDDSDNLPMMEYINTVDIIPENIEATYIETTELTNVYKNKFEKNISEFFGMPPVSEIISNDFISAEIPKLRVEVVIPSDIEEIVPKSKYIKTKFRNFGFANEKEFMEKLKEQKTEKSEKIEKIYPKEEFTMKLGRINPQELFGKNTKNLKNNAFTNYSDFL